jgi:Arc/MetJ-type ribon-helix-helix transcriptional regulator
MSADMADKNKVQARSERKPRMLRVRVSGEHLELLDDLLGNGRIVTYSEGIRKSLDLMLEARNRGHVDV